MKGRFEFNLLMSILIKLNMKINFLKGQLKKILKRNMENLFGASSKTVFGMIQLKIYKRHGEQFKVILIMNR